MAINFNHDTDTITATSGTLSIPNFSGGLTHFVASESTASPNATVPVDALTATDASYTNIDVAIVAKGTGATLAQVPDGTTAGGDKRGQYATDLQKSRSATSYVASGGYSFIGSGKDNTSSNWHTFVGAGNGNVASGDTSAVVGGLQNVASANYSVIVSGAFNLASGQQSAVVGGGSNISTGAYSFIGGGQSNTASSSSSFVGGGQSNTAQTSSHATVCGGNSNTASGQFAFVGGGSGSTASGPNAVVGGGQNCTATATLACTVGGDANTATNSYACILGGANNVADGQYSAVLGGRRGTTRGIVGYQVSACCSAPIAAVAGVTQSALLLLGRETTDATATILTSNTSTPSTSNQVILPNNSAYSFSGEVIAGVTGAGNTARWTINGAIKRGASAATTAMVGTPTVTMTHNDAGASGWIVNVTPDAINGGIAVIVTGAPSTTIRWVCKINTTEMTF